MFVQPWRQRLRFSSPTMFWFLFLSTDDLCRQPVEFLEGGGALVRLHPRVQAWPSEGCGSLPREVCERTTTCWTRRHWRLKTGKLQVAWTYSENWCFFLFFIIFYVHYLPSLRGWRSLGVEHLSDPGKCHVFQMNVRCLFYGRYQLSYNICHILINGSSLFNQSHLTT